MIKHVVCWKLLDQAQGRSKAENAALLRDRLMALRPLMDGIVEMEVGIDCTQGSGNYDACLVSMFSSKEALDAYKVHPAHVKVSAFCNEIRESRVAVDWEL
jgi:hypothetical protein